MKAKLPAREYERTIGYVAEVFAVGEETVRVWCRQGKFGEGAQKVGNEWRIRQSAVDKLAHEMYGD